MTTNVTKLIRTSLRKIGALPSGTTLKTAELADGRDELRRMLDTWRLESLMIYHTNLRSFSLQPGRVAYDYGTGGHFNAPRPVRIEAAVIVNSAGGRHPLTPMTAEEYMAVSYRGEVGSPDRFFFHTKFPMAEVRFDRVPDDPTVELSVLEELIELPSDSAEDFNLPPGYEDALVYNLGMRLAGEYDVDPGKEVIGLAMAGKSLIKRANFHVPALMIDYAGVNVRGTYDITAGPVR